MFIEISDHKEMLQKIIPVFVNTVLSHSVIYDNFNVIWEGILERNPEAAPSVQSHSVIYGNFNVIWEGILERNPLAAPSKSFAPSISLERPYNVQPTEKPSSCTQCLKSYS
jgi:hypothetical protein